MTDISSTAVSAPSFGTLPTGTLSARGLACRRGRRLLFSRLDLELPPGRLLWLRGANGSGKTSLLRILAGLSAPTEGAVLWNGEPLAQAGAAARACCLYIGHANALKDDLTLAESLGFLAALQGLDDIPSRVGVALARVGLATRSGAWVRTLSQGQRRRGALARLALDEATPRTWLLDEPFDALDQASVATLAALIAGQGARGGAVLFTSHQAVDLPGLATLDLPAEPVRTGPDRPADGRAWKAAA